MPPLFNHAIFFALLGLSACALRGPQESAASGGGGKSPTTSGAVVTSVDGVSSTGSGGAGQGSLLPPAGKLYACADTDRNGVLDAADLDGRSVFAWQRGAFVLANIDDDDGNGVPDVDDATATGDDLADLASLRVELGADVFAAAGSVVVEVVTGAEHLRVLRFAGAEASPVVGPLAVAEVLELGIDARNFAGSGWSGEARVVVRAYSKNGEQLASDEVALRVAPLLLLPSSAVPIAIHTATGALANSTFLTELGLVTVDAKANLLPPYATKKLLEMWVQDTVELGYTQLPTLPPMHVALRANRGQDSYALTLRGPGMGYLEVGAPRSLPVGDEAIDGYGNLEVSPPVPGWPLGRIYYGQNTDTGATLHPAVVAFFEAQQLQAPFWVNTSWLATKHVDELLTFVLDANKKTRLLVVSTAEAGKLHPSVYGPYSKGLQVKLDLAMNGGSYLINGKTVFDEGVLKHLGLTAADVVPLPLYFTAGRPDWSNPVNGIFLGAGLYAAGGADVLASDRTATAARFAANGLEVRWLYDAVYHSAGGNVHSATNATRLPSIGDFTNALPPSL